MISNQSEYRSGCRQLGTYVKWKLQKTAYCIVVESRDVPPKHTHTLPAALILLKDSYGQLFLVSLEHALPIFKVRPVSPDFKVEADWLKCAASQNVKLLRWPADTLSVTRSPHPSSSPSLPATTVANRKTQSRAPQSKQNGR